MLIRLTLIALIAAAPAAETDDLEKRATELRADIAAADPAQPPSQRTAGERLLLTSIERRQDLERARADLTADVAQANVAKGEDKATPPGRSAIFAARSSTSTFAPRCCATATAPRR
jgi:hypothetical protein